MGSRADGTDRMFAVKDSVLLSGLRTVNRRETCTFRQEVR